MATLPRRHIDPMRQRSSFLETVMKFLPTLVLALTAAACAAAGAETVISTQAAQERRDRNVDEALARYRATHGSGDDHTASGRETTRERAHEAADTVRGKTHRAAKSVRGFTHRQAEKARDFGDRQNAKFGTDGKPATEDGVRK
jgi:hypothetical protein